MKARALCLAVAAALLFACASPGPRAVHVVRPGENLYRIARHYGVPVRDIVRANRVRDVTNLPVGARLVIPDTRRQPPREPLLPSETARAAASEQHHADRRLDARFTWPVRGRVSSGFGHRRGRPHEGIDIPAPQGTPVRAAEAGRVIHSGRGLGAYGVVVIVKHTGPYSTVYAHNRKNLVRKGDFVEKGQVIAQVGRTGNASGPHLHFEIRRNKRALDPLRMLP